MKDLPHRYTVSAEAAGDVTVCLDSAGLPSLATTTPPEFDGPEGRWSPETLLVASVADCLVLTVRGVARASRLTLTAVSCEVRGTLDRVGGLLQFTAFEATVRVQAPEGVDLQHAARVLEKAERTCLITNSLKAPLSLEVELNGVGFVPVPAIA
ncbi:MAG TPA: OsmC family protein [Vicinamibacterales bacterium]|nr:OsmC family protein [Vicinamibacterales bacterium]